MKQEQEREGPYTEMNVTVLIHKSTVPFHNKLVFAGQPRQKVSKETTSNSLQSQFWLFVLKIFYLNTISWKFVYKMYHVFINYVSMM